MKKQDKIKLFQSKGMELQTSFENIKTNPLNFNLLMSHIGLLSSIVHDIINDNYPNPSKENTNEK